MWHKATKIPKKISQVCNNFMLNIIFIIIISIIMVRNSVSGSTPVSGKHSLFEIAVRLKWYFHSSNFHGHISLQITFGTAALVAIKTNLS